MGTKEPSKPSNAQPAPQGGMKSQPKKPPITNQADTRGQRDTGSFMKGKPTTPRGGSASTANKKPTP